MAHTHTHKEGRGQEKHLRQKDKTKKVEDGMGKSRKMIRRNTFIISDINKAHRDKMRTETRGKVGKWWHCQDLVPLF